MSISWITSYQDDPVFSNVTGEHFITINDKKGTCNPTVLTTTVLKYLSFLHQTMTDSTITGTFPIWLHNQCTYFYL
jgi:hypothetical protein